MNRSNPVAHTPGLPRSGHATDAPGAPHAPSPLAPGATLPHVRRVSRANRVPGIRFLSSRGRIVAHSVTISGHRTSVTMESRFWAHLKRIAGNEAMTLRELVLAIDTERQLMGLRNLSACLRMAVLDDLEARAFAPGTFGGVRGAMPP